MGTQKLGRLRADGFIFRGMRTCNGRTYEHWISPEAWARKQERQSTYETRYRQRRSKDPAKLKAYNEYANEYGKGWRRANPARAMFLRARGRAAEKGLEFTIVLGDIVIPKRCPVFGMPLLIGGGDSAP